MASVTGFASRYHRDIFYRTGWNVLILQILFAGALIALTFISLSYLYEEIVRALLSAITMSVATGIDPSSDSAVIAATLEYEKQKNMVLTGTGVLMIAAIFSWLITAMALRPTRVALTSQKQFVGNIAHELRTPLSIIKTNTEVALFNTRLDPETKEVLISNTEELNRISEIINNLLSMNALLTPGKIVLVNVDLSQIIERVTRSLERLSKEKRIEIQVHDNAGRFVRGNAAALEQILMNVVKNALHYTPLGGTVTLITRPDFRDRVEIEVQDTGVGIPESDLERVFEPFYRGDKARTRRGGAGSGLGLAIVGELVRMHKGQIRIRSTEGHGTTVTISLPRGTNEAQGKSSHERVASTVDFS